MKFKNEVNQSKMSCSKNAFYYWLNILNFYAQKTTCSLIEFNFYIFIGTSKIKKRKQEDKNSIIELYKTYSISLDKYGINFFSQCNIIYRLKMVVNYEIRQNTNLPIVYECNNNKKETNMILIYK